MEEINLVSEIQIVRISMVKESSLEVEYGLKIGKPSDAVHIIKRYLHDRDRECLIVLTLDTKNKITGLHCASIGSLNGTVIHPREVFKVAILSNAASIILAHNHPSGEPKASSEDINSTNRINECGKILGIELLDHIITGDGEKFVSLKEQGII